MDGQRGIVYVESLVVPVKARATLLTIAAFTAFTLAARPADARTLPYWTRVMVANLPGADGEAPAFTTIAALDEYYGLADGGGCGDDCLKREWITLSFQNRTTHLMYNHPVKVTRVVGDPASPGFTLCRIQYEEVGAVSAWVLCTTLRDQPR